MEPIDLLALSKTSPRMRNAHLARTSLLPHCVRNFGITSGPSLPTICGAPSNVVPRDLSLELNLAHHTGQSKLIDDHIPLQFTLLSGYKREQRVTFPVLVFVRSIDFGPDLSQVHWSLFGHALSGNNSHLYFPPKAIVIRGWFRAMSKDKEAPKDLRANFQRECLIVYDPKHNEGWLGEVAAAEELPTSGVIKDLEVFHRVVRERYISGFIESYAPDGVTRWGRISGGCDWYVEIDAEKKGDIPWRYRTKKEPIMLNLIAVEHKKGEGWELAGDMFLCSDETMLHSHFLRSTCERKAPEDWVEGYYSNRLYPPGSPMIPKYIADSFASEMPAWFYQDDEARKKECLQLA